MNFQTLKIIESLLQKNVEEKQEHHNKVKERLNHCYDLQETESPEYKEGDLKYWKESERNSFEKLIEAKDALREFLDHPWR